MLRLQTSAMLILICLLSHYDSDSPASTTSEDHGEEAQRLSDENAGYNDTKLLRSVAARSVRCAIAVVVGENQA